MIIVRIVLTLHMYDTKVRISSKNNVVRITVSGDQA